MNIMDEEDCLFRKASEHDPSLLESLENHRSHDINKILKRLEVFNQQIQGLIHSPAWTSPQVHRLLLKLLKTYLHTADSIKISRAVEKVWNPFLKEHSTFLNEHLTGLVFEVLNQVDIDCQLFTKVSVLLEQSKLVQAVFQGNVAPACGIVCGHLKSIIQFPPLELSAAQGQLLYALVKICLQLFQVCPEHFQLALWSEDCDVKYSEHASAIARCLIHILSTQGYATDCVLLCGTSVALMLNTCPDPNKAASIIIAIFKAVTLADDKNNSIDSLRNITEINASEITVMETKMKNLSSESLGPVAFCRGVVSCGHLNILLSPWRSCKENNESLLSRMYSFIVLLCQGSITLHYQSFQILLLWYSRLSKIPSEKESSIFGAEFASTLESTWSLVILNWDSPVEDVPEIVVEVFSAMMHIWNNKITLSPRFAQGILKLLLRTPWHVKGKYRIYGALLKFVETKSICEMGEIQCQLLKCLTTNHLSSCSTALYKSFLEKLSGQDNSVEQWEGMWLSSMIEGLTSNDSLLRYNTSLHWIPVTLKLVAQAAEVIQSYLVSEMDSPITPTGRTRLLHAWVIVAKNVRILTGKSDLSSPLIRESLYSADEDVRSDAISTICNTLKKAESLSELESGLLKDCLPSNIKVDSAPFRQHLGSDIRKLLVRLRDSCVTLLKNPEQNQTCLDCAINFVDWLHRLCISGLLPGASYQRRKGSLDLLHVVYETLIHVPDSRQRKGFVPETALKVVEHAGPCWDFFTPANTRTLLTCLLDGAEEIRSSVYFLLTRFYRWPLQNNVSTAEDLCCHLVTEALRLCNSPKGQEGQTGAVLCKLSFQKYVIESNYMYGITIRANGDGYSVTVTPGCHGNNEGMFLGSLLTETRRCFAEAEKNLVKASKEYPIHGLISALTACLCDVGARQDTDVERGTLAVSLALVTLCQNIIDKMLSIMAGVAGQEACPSFAEIGEALENILLEGSGDYTEGTALSPEYQYMLSWCWNNIKESCTSLGEITQKLVTRATELPPSFIPSIKSTFLAVLTKCRHKGVIEGCRSAFVTFCSALFSSSDESVYSIPAGILREVLLSLKQKSILSSVTRRSAGLPIIVQAIIVSEKQTKKNILLCEALLGLFDLCKLPLDIDPGVTDLPQVHGINMLNTLFSEASLSGSLIGHTGHVTIMVVRLFGSPSWAVRNAATRLFSTLVTKLFGQKKSQENKLCNSVTYKEFSAYYPELPPFLLEVLKEASERDLQNICTIHPCLFPVLTLLSSLNPMDSQDGNLKEEMDVYRNLIKRFTASPVYQLRHLVAQALVAMVTREDMKSSLMSCLEVSISYSVNDVNVNSIHGDLLFVQKVLEYIASATSVHAVWQELVGKAWLLNSTNGIVSGLYLQILTTLLKCLQDVDVPAHLVEAVIKICLQDKKIIGDSVVCQAGVHFLLAASVHSGKSTCTLIGQLMSADNLETRKACLQFLCDSLDELDIDDPYEIIDQLAEAFCMEIYLQNRYQILDLVARLNLKYDTRNLDTFETLGSCTLDPLVWDFTGQSSLMIVVEAIGIEHAGFMMELHGLPTNSCSLSVAEFCSRVKQCSLGTNETERLSAARALQIAGSRLLLVTPPGNHTVDLMSACFTLIQDEDSDIRTEACVFVSQMLNDAKISQYPSLHSNLCFAGLLQYFSSAFSNSPTCVQFLFDHLTPNNDLASVLKERVTGRLSQLFDHEDNSFFAERIYNSFEVHRCIKAIMEQCNKEGRQLPVTVANNQCSCLVQSLHTLHGLLNQSAHGEVFSVFDDSVVVSNTLEVLLTCDIVKHLDVAESKTIRELVSNLQMHRLPPAVYTALPSSLSTS